MKGPGNANSSEGDAQHAADRSKAEARPAREISAEAKQQTRVERVKNDDSQFQTSGGNDEKGNDEKLTNGNGPRGATGPTFKRRAGQREFIRGVEEHRLAGLLARRQYGKTTIAAQIALKKMMKHPGHTVVFGSVKVDLGREIVRKEAEALQKAIAALIEQAKSAGAKFDAVDQEKGRSVISLSADDFAELYEAQRLEFRLHHSQTVYSRTKVVALTPAAVGETGDLILDEVGRVKNFREVWEAVKPIIASNPEFRCMLTTTPPPDDGHFSFELLAPPIDAQFKPNPAGNWYRSEVGIWVLRIDAWDAFADGVPLYDDDTGAPMNPEEARAKEYDKTAWDRNYGVQFTLGGTTAVGLLQLDSAMRRGIGQCACIVIDQDIDFDRAIDFLRTHLGPGPVGIGIDLATTEKGSSNPTALTVMERDGINVIARVTIVWKTADPALAKERFRNVVEAVNGRTEGGRARRLCIDATNERYFATEVQRELAALVPVELVIGSETLGGAIGENARKLEKRDWATMPGQGKEPIKVKALLGNRLVGVFDDNQITVAPEQYLKRDVRSVKRDRGSFDAELGPNGEHGDVFDSLKLGLHALDSTGGAISSVAGIATGKRNGGAGVFRPARLPREGRVFA